MSFLKRYILFFALLAGVLWGVFTTTACRHEGGEVGNLSLSFSVDTVMFDTAFVSFDTPVKSFIVYNRHNSAVVLDAVTLVGGSRSRFRLNVDGDTSLVVRNLRIEAHDSLFIFVRANLSPTSDQDPFLIEDAILFTSNNKEVTLPVWAYGRNAVYHLPDRSLPLGDGSTLKYSVIDVSTWDHTKPHIIFGYAVVDEGSGLQLGPGDELYFANDACLWVYEGGCLVAQGTATNPVLFTSLRHDAQYDALPSQWQYIWLSGGSLNNYIDWAVIENAQCGIRADTCVNDRPTAWLQNSIIRNHSLAGIVGQGATIEGDNLLVYNCGTATLLLQAGGNYLFRHCTFADYWAYSGSNRRKTPSIILTNYHEYEGVHYPRPLSLTMQNSIVWGNHYVEGLPEEFLLNYDEGADMTLDFDHCLLRTQQVDSLSHPGKALLINKDPLFLNVQEEDYRLQATSPARAAGNRWLQVTPYDLNFMAWQEPPSIGCYEWADTSATDAKLFRRISLPIKH